MSEIYMDANTIDLKNIKFPDSLIMQSKLGYPTFGNENKNWTVILLKMSIMEQTLSIKVFIAIRELYKIFGLSPAVKLAQIIRICYDYLQIFAFY